MRSPRSGRTSTVPVNGALEIAEKPDALLVGEGEELHHDGRAQTPARIDPVISVVHTGPGQTPGRTPSLIGGGIHQEPERVLVDSARMEIHVAGDRRPRRFQNAGPQRTDLV